MRNDGDGSMNDDFEIEVPVGVEIPPEFLLGKVYDTFERVQKIVKDNYININKPSVCYIDDAVEIYWMNKKARRSVSIEIDQQDESICLSTMDKESGWVDFDAPSDAMILEKILWVLNTPRC